MTLQNVSTKSLIVAAVAIGSIGLAVRTLVGPSDHGSTRDVRTRNALVERVINGHKIELEPDENLIYAGIRAPYLEEPLGQDALDLNRRLVEGKKIRIRFDEVQTDKKGRTLGYVFVDGEMINERLVAEGLAYVRAKSSQQRFLKMLLTAQNEARKARRGLWKARVVSSCDHYPGDRKHGAFHRPDCADVPNTRPEHKIEFASRRKAFDAGFVPCTRCDP